MSLVCSKFKVFSVTTLILFSELLLYVYLCGIYHRWLGSGYMLGLDKFQQPFSSSRNIKSANFVLYPHRVLTGLQKLSSPYISVFKIQGLKSPYILQKMTAEVHEKSLNFYLPAVGWV